MLSSRSALDEWVAVMVLRNAALAWLLVDEADRYTAGISFYVGLASIPILGWAALFALSALLAGAALVVRWRARSPLLRLRITIAAILFSAMLSGYWALSFFFAAVEVRDASKLLVVVFGGLTLKDLVVLRSIARTR